MDFLVFINFLDFFIIKKIKIAKVNGTLNGNLMEKLNWINIKVRGLNWNGQNLKDWSELWPNLKGVICNLALLLLQSHFIEFW